MSHESFESNPYRDVDMHSHTPEAISQAQQEILALAQMQNPTGRTNDENDRFTALIQDMQNGKLTPAEAITQARAFADARQDGFGGSVAGLAN